MLNDLSDAREYASLNEISNLTGIGRKTLKEMCVEFNVPSITMMNHKRWHKPSINRVISR